MANEIQLLNDNNGKSFFFRAVAGYKVKKAQPAISIPLVNTSAENNLLFRFSGQSEEITFNFAIYNDGNDVGSGNNIVTVEEQIKYLKNEIFTHEYDVTWTFHDLTDTVYDYLTGVLVVIQSIDFDLKQGAQTVVTGSVTLLRGKLAGVSS